MLEDDDDDDVWCDFQSPKSTQKMRKFEQILNSLRREFKRLMRENKQLKDTISVNLPTHDFSNPIKSNESINSPQAVSELNLKSRKVNSVPMQEDNSVPENILTSDLPQTPTKSKISLEKNEIPEVLSVEFDSDSEQSLLERFERTKSASNSSEKLQKSPVISNKKRIKLKKSQSPRVDLTPKEISSNSAKKDSKKLKNKPVTESPKYISDVAKPLDIPKSLFSSFKGKEDQTFVSPQPKVCSKLGLTKLYNVNTKLLSNGKKLKQTKLIFTAEEEITDISCANFSNEATYDTCDSIFDLSLLNSNVDTENMETDIEDQFSSRKSSPNAEKNTPSSKKDNVDEISPSPVNSCLKKIKKQAEVLKKSRKVFKSPKNDKAVSSKVFNSRADETFFVPQACSTQFPLTMNLAKCEQETIQHLGSDHDTHFSFDAKHTLKKQYPSQAKKTILADVSNTSPQSDKRKDYQSQERNVPVTETVFEDETFFSPGECRNGAGEEDIANPTTSVQKKSTSPKVKRVLLSSFDQVPESKKRGPESAYDFKSVRRKCDRMKLNGWSCWDCKKYYEALQLTEEELKECMKHCSRHKAKYDPVYNTPPGFWDPGFPDTIGLSLSGYPK